MRKILLGIFLSTVGLIGVAQETDGEKKYESAIIGFYNFENLFDTLVDPDTTKILQKEFTPEGKNRYGSFQYYSKLNNLSKVVSDMGTEFNADGPAILGIAEIENRSVLEDFVKHPNIKDRNYKIVHEEGPDKRGIDPALIYNPKYFEYQSHKSFSVVNPEDSTWKTRDQLLVSGKLLGEEVHVLVCHWPSRRGGAKASAFKRALAADVSRSVVDSILKINAMAKVFVMGDLNDDPISPSVKKHLKTKKTIEKMEPGFMYNPWDKFYAKGVGTLAYKDAWNLFDQIIMTEGVVQQKNNELQFFSAKVYNKEYLKNQDGKYSGQPFRTYSFGKFIGGYSDHFPTYIYIAREKK